MQNELFKQEIGFCTRVNQLIDELFIIITRQLTKQNNSGGIFLKPLCNWNKRFVQNLAHQWTVEEMAAVMGIGTTSFNEKVKNYIGVFPINYLINIRISEAIKLLKQQGCKCNGYCTGYRDFIHRNIFQQHLKNLPVIRQVN